jgi:hypothetical protein
MSTNNLPDDGLVRPTDATFGIEEPAIVSASAAQNANRVEGAEETSEKPSFDFEAAAARRQSEF